MFCHKMITHQVQLMFCRYDWVFPNKPIKSSAKQHTGCSQRNQSINMSSKLYTAALKQKNPPPRDMNTKVEGVHWTTHSRQHCQILNSRDHLCVPVAVHCCFVEASISALCSRCFFLCGPGSVKINQCSSGCLCYNDRCWLTVLMGPGVVFVSDQLSSPLKFGPCFSTIDL